MGALIVYDQMNLDQDWSFYFGLHKERLFVYNSNGGDDHYGNS